jgi:phosphatidylserine/phosphatidylglycerophosphate/cardiolipin synthase-like enzyme
MLSRPNSVARARRSRTLTGVLMRLRRAGSPSVLSPGFRLRLRRGLRRGALSLIAAQGVAVVILTGVDSWRKRLRPRHVSFPHSETETMSVGLSKATVYAFGTALYDDMLAAIHGAQHRVLFESFIFKDDEVGQAFKRALIEAAARGVEVFVIYDGFANLVVRRRFFSFGPQVQVMRYPVFRAGVLLLDVRKSGRDHRKLLVVDGEHGFVGGYNIGSAYATQWRDTHLRLTGPAAWDLENAFIEFWNSHRSTGPNTGNRGCESTATFRPSWSTRFAACIWRRSTARGIAFSSRRGTSFQTARSSPRYWRRRAAASRSAC